MKIDKHTIGGGNPVFVIAEMSANHNQDLAKAEAILRMVKDAGADAVKLQTYTPDTLTIDCDNEHFRIKGTLWQGRLLYDLYGEAFTPWEWQPRLKAIADDLGLLLFSSPFDATAVDFLEGMGVPAYKVASFEIVDMPLLKKIASTRKPVIVSTGMASLSEIDEAVRALRDGGSGEIALLKCTSAYPAPYSEMNLRTIPHLGQIFGVPAGLSDHTLGIEVPVAAVALGACIVEKHVTLSRSDGGPDSAFSLEPQELKAMVMAIRSIEKALGGVNFELTSKERSSLVFRRSLFVVEDIAAGECFTEKNVRSIRPGTGLHTRYLDVVLGKHAERDIARGTPLSWDLVN